MTSRRKFIINASGLVATGLVAGSVNALGNSLQTRADDQKDIIYRKLGCTGVNLPIVSMGVMNSNNPNLIKVGWQMGIRHFDTAWIYQGGNNEKMVGSVLKELKVDRKDVTITTKIIIDHNLWQPEFAEARKKQMLERFNQSLERLQMDYVDILMLHDVSQIEQVNDPAIMSAMQELKDAGKIRFPAFSTHVYWPEILTAAADKGFFDVVLLSLNYSMANDDASDKALKYATSKGMGLIAMKTQCQQDWYKQGLPADAQKYYEGGIMHAALLKWVLNHDEITTAVPGFTTFEQLQTDMSVAHDLNYTTEEKQFLEDHHVKLAIQSACRFCGGCKDTCPYGTDIPSLMRTHMYAMGYGNMHMTKTTFNSIEKGRSLDACNGCTTCVAECKNRVQIAGKINELKELFA